MAEKEKSASLRPSEAKTGGGLFGDLDLEITGAKFHLFDYGGTAAQAVPAAHFDFKDGEGAEYAQDWSMGNAKEWIPSPDGTKLIYVGQSENPALSASSNGMLMFTSLVNAGYPEDKITDDITDFVGLLAHWERQPAPVRKGLERQPRADGKVFEQTILLCTKVVKLPWEKGEKKAGRPAGKKAEGKKEEAAAAAGGDLDDVATEAVVRLLVASGPMTIVKVGTALFKDAEIPANMRQAVATRVYKEDFHQGKPWKKENGTLTMIG